MSATFDNAATRTRSARSAAASALARSPLGQRLVGANLIAEAELETALSRQAQSGQRLGETLLELGFVTESTLR